MYAASSWSARPSGMGGCSRCNQVVETESMQLAKILTAQEVLGEIDLAPLLTEVLFLVREGHQDDGAGDAENDELEDLLFNATTLHLAVQFDLQGIAKVLLPHAGTALRVAAGTGRRSPRRTPLHLASALGRTTMAMLLL